MATSLTHLFSKDRTFRAKKRWDEGTLRHNLHKHAKATLQSGLDLKQCVKLPPNETLEDWIAVHVVDFFNRVNLIYGTISEFCTPETCPIMSGGPKYEYHWADGTKTRNQEQFQLQRLLYCECLTYALNALLFLRKILCVGNEPPVFYEVSATDKNTLQKYMELLMDWIEGLVNNPNIFPPDDSIPFPKMFLPTCKKY